MFRPNPYSPVPKLFPRPTSGPIEQPPLASMQLRPFASDSVAGSPNLAGEVRVALPVAPHTTFAVFCQDPPSQLMSQLEPTMAMSDESKTVNKKCLWKTFIAIVGSDGRPSTCEE